MIINFALLYFYEFYQIFELKQLSIEFLMIVFFLKKLLNFYCSLLKLPKKYLQQKSFHKRAQKIKNKSK